MPEQQHSVNVDVNSGVRYAANQLRGVWDCPETWNQQEKNTHMVRENFHIPDLALYYKVSRSNVEMRKSMLFPKTLCQKDDLQKRGYKCKKQLPQ